MRIRRLLVLLFAVLFFIALPVCLYFIVFPCVTVVSDAAQRLVMPGEEWGELWLSLLRKGFRFRVVFPDPVLFSSKESTSAYLSEFSDSATVVLMQCAASAVHCNKINIRTIFPESGVCGFCPGWDDFDLCIEEKTLSGWRQACLRLYDFMPSAAVVYTDESKEEILALSELLESDGAMLYRLEKNTSVYLKSVAQDIKSRKCSYVLSVGVPDIGTLLSSLDDVYAVVDWRYSGAVEKNRLQGIIAPSLAGVIVPVAGLENSKLKILGKVDADYEYIPRRVL